MQHRLYSIDNEFIEETNDWPDNFTGIVVHDNGTKQWYINGLKHRIDGPADEYADGTKCWYFNDQLHRLDGPACEYPDGTKYWFINDKQVTEQEHDLLYSIMKLKGLL